MLAKASTLMNCKIQTHSAQTNISVNFTPPKVTDEDCFKILYYQHKNFIMCQRGLVEIRKNMEDNDLSKQREPDLSEVCIQKMEWKLFRNYYVVYGYDRSHAIYEVEIYEGLSVLQKFERFVKKISHDSTIAFILNQTNAPFVPLFVKALLRYLGRKPPIDAKHDSNIVKK